MPLTLADMGFKLGDLVTFNSNRESTGGIVFRISANFDSPVPDNERNCWSANARTVGAAYAINGRRLKPMEVAGYLRLAPTFSFCPTSLGQDPMGAAGTVLVHHTALKRDQHRMQKVDLVTLGAKYIELGNFLRYLASYEGTHQLGASAAEEPCP